MRNYNKGRSLLFANFLSLKFHLDYVLTFLAVPKGKQLLKRKKRAHYHSKKKDTTIIVSETES